MAQAGSGMRILIYSQDGFGLGHLRRNLNISLQIKKQAPDASILIVADSPVAPFFRLPPRCDFIKLPTIVKVDTGVWRPNRLAMHYDDLLKIRSEIIQDVALSFKPHVFLVDHMPHGALGELAGPLEMLKRAHPETRVFLGLRDILGDNDVIHNMWDREGAFDAAREYYDGICIYGSENIFPLTDAYRFPEDLVSKAAYCGYVSRDAGLSRKPNKQLLRKIFPKRKGKLILVTGGGGADASYFMDKFIDAAKLLRKEVYFKAVVSTGPFMHKDQVALLKKKAKGVPLFVRRIRQDSIDFIRSAHLVISMAGYNTVSEILRFRKNAIIVPRPGPSAEQTMRANLFSERSLFDAIHPNDLSAETFARTIYTRLKKGSPMKDAVMPDLNGAPNVARALIASVNGEPAKLSATGN